MNSPISTGTTVTESSAAAAMANVLVKASGRNNRPSSACNAKIGMNESVMINSVTNRAGPTSRAATVTNSQRGRSGSCSMCLCRFSIITIAASIMAPMAMAIPPSDMMLALTPTQRVAARAMRIPSGRIAMATTALRTWSKNTMHTRATMTDSSNSVRARVAVARLIKCDRS